MSYIPSVQFLLGRLEFFSADVLVNAAGTDMHMNGGVALALKKKAGSKVEQEALKFAGCKPGQVIPTSAGTLSSKYIFHAVVLSSETGKATVESIRSSVRNSLQLADSLKCNSIAFPALGCGFAKFPIERAASIMLTELASFKSENSLCIFVVLFSEKDLGVFNSIWDDLIQPSHAKCLEWVKERNPSNIVNHSVRVNKIAVFLARALQLHSIPIDVTLVDRTSLIHDLDKFETIQGKGKHGHRGAVWLREHNLPRWAEITERHNAHFILAPDFPTRPWEDKIVWYADKRVRHDVLVSLEERFNYLIERYGKTPEIVQRLHSSLEKAQALERELMALAHVDVALSSLH